MKPKRPPHRPTALTPEISARICAALSVGSYRAPAAAFAGISEATLYNWLARGEKEPGIYRDFLEAVKKAEAEAELRHVQRIDKASTEQWQASAWMLERKFPQRWGRQLNPDQEVTVRAVLVLPQTLTPEEYERQWLREHPEKLQ